MADNNKKKKNKVKPLVVLAIVVVVAIAIVGVTLAAANPNKKDFSPKQTEGNTKPNEEDFGSRLVYNGKEYRRNPDISTLLFIGVDQESDEQWDQFEEAAEGVIGNSGRSDTIILFIMNDATKETQMLLVSRDTITDVDVYDQKGDFKYSGPMQITLQYAFGDSPTKSLFLTKRTVGELLYNIRIDGALSLTMDGIRDVVDRLGGITLTMPEDYSYIDERYTEGATVTLNGTEMEHFIRYRGDETGSNEARVARQSWLIGAVFKELKAKGAMTFIQEIIDSHPEYITSDCDAELLKTLSRYQMTDEKYKVPGEVVAGDLHDEFYVDEEALKELIINLLYVPVEEETTK